jgi:Family of unknown function (DUF6319)
MRPSTRLALAAVIAGLAASSAAAQPDLVGLEKVHQLFTSGQARLAARELSVVSVAFRGEIGRCRDESLGAKLMEVEPRIDALVKGLNTGTLTSAAALEQEFVVIDQLLAQNHQQLAATQWGLRRFGGLDIVAKDLALAAGYVTRASRWAHTPLSGPMQKVVNDARAAAEKLAADPANPAADTGAMIEALGKAMKGMN